VTDLLLFELILMLDLLPPPEIRPSQYRKKEKSRIGFPLFIDRPARGGGNLIVALTGEPLIIMRGKAELVVEENVFKTMGGVGYEPIRTPDSFSYIYIYSIILYSALKMIVMMSKMAASLSTSSIKWNIYVKRGCQNQQTCNI